MSTFDTDRPNLVAIDARRPQRQTVHLQITRDATQHEVLAELDALRALLAEHWQGVQLHRRAISFTSNHPEAYFDDAIPF